MSVARSFVIVPAPGGAFCYTADLDAAGVHEALDGWLEAVPTNRQVTAFCNEEGRLLDLLPNPVAVWLLSQFGYSGGPLVGPVVVQGPVNAAGDCTDVPSFVEAALRSL